MSRIDIKLKVTEEEYAIVDEYRKKHKITGIDVALKYMIREVLFNRVRIYCPKCYSNLVFDYDENGFKWYRCTDCASEWCLHRNML